MLYLGIGVLVPAVSMPRMVTWKWPAAVPQWSHGGTGAASEVLDGLSVANTILDGSLVILHTQLNGITLVLQNHCLGLGEIFGYRTVFKSPSCSKISRLCCIQLWRPLRSVKNYTRIPVYYLLIKHWTCIRVQSFRLCRWWKSMIRTPRQSVHIIKYNRTPL